jgi:hypothetical protein
VVVTRVSGTLGALNAKPRRTYCREGLTAAPHRLGQIARDCVPNGSFVCLQRNFAKGEAAGSAGAAARPGARRASDWWGSGVPQ